MADDTVMEEREELMVCPTSGLNEHYRNAHFLKPSAAAADTAAHPSAAASRKGFPVKVNFPAWGCRSPRWKAWVDQMRSSHDATWRSAGILDAIIRTTYFIPRCEDLISGLAKKWSPSTNSFLFPWGEATITLQDMAALAAYSVVGHPVFFAAGDAEVDDKVTKLLESRMEIYNSPIKKACLSRWKAKFMSSGSEIEHEAFLAYWLSKFVFPFSSLSIGRAVIPIAVQLARGERISLAPAVLASIYRALTLLKEGDLKMKRKRNRKRVVSAPLALVQVWAWERLPLLRPNPKRVGPHEPRIARWVGAIRGSKSVDSAGEDMESFRWRPYTSECDEEALELELESFVRCMRVSRLVGLENGCVEQYLPHRVARQFGMDQDLPGHVAFDRSDDEVAWSDYVRPAGDREIYVPSPTYQPRVTRRYFEWWRSVAVAAVTEPLEDEMDVDDNVDVDDVVPQRPVMRRCTRAYNAKKPAFGGRGCFRISKSKYLQQFRRQRNVGFASSESHSSASAFKSSGKSSVKSSGKSPRSLQKSSEKSNESSQKSSRKSSEKSYQSSAECSQKSSGKSHESSQKSSKWIRESSERSMSAPSKASELGSGCEIEGSRKERVDENVVKLSELAMVDGAEGKIDVEGLEEKVRIVEEILKLIKTGTLVCHIPQKHRKRQC